MRNMQPAVDDIITALYSQDRDAEQNAGDLYQRYFTLEETQENSCRLGLVIPYDQLEFDPQRVRDRLESVLPEERVDALEDGAAPTDEERQAYEAAVIQSAENADDADGIPGFFLHHLKHTDGREAFALVTVTGYSFSELSSEFYGFFSSVNEAKASLLEWGLVTREESMFGDG